MPTSYLVSLIAALLVTALLIPLVRRIALHTDFVDHPNDAKVHTAPTPYLGGVALAVAVLLSLVAGVHFVPRLSVLVLTGVSLAAIGLIDDRRTLSPLVRLAAQVCAGFAVVGVGLVARVTGVAVVDAALTIGWVVVVTNAFNLLDNMDGLAAGCGAASALGVAVLGGLHTQSVIGPLAAAMVGACLGFLFYNWAPASIFMGDAGSLFLGFFLSVLALGARSSVTMPGGVIVTLMIVAIPLLDTTTVVVARLSHHRSIFVGGRDHLSHRLVTRGARTPFAVGLLVMTQLMMSTLAVAVGDREINLALGTAIGVAFMGLVAALAAPARVYATKMVPRRAGAVVATGLSVLTLVAAMATASSSRDPGAVAALTGPLASPLVLLGTLLAGVGVAATVVYFVVVGREPDEAVSPAVEGLEPTVSGR